MKGRLAQGEQSDQQSSKVTMKSSRIRRKWCVIRGNAQVITMQETASALWNGQKPDWKQSGKLYWEVIREERCHCFKNLDREKGGRDRTTSKWDRPSEWGFFPPQGDKIVLAITGQWSILPGITRRGRQETKEVNRAPSEKMARSKVETKWKMTDGN